MRRALGVLVVVLTLSSATAAPTQADRAIPATRHAHKHTPCSYNQFIRQAARIYSGLRTVSATEVQHLRRMERCATVGGRAIDSVNWRIDRRAWQAREHEPMAYLAWHYHHWDATQVGYEWLVLHRESTSSPGHLSLRSYNPDGCAGSGQLSGGFAAYYHYPGGNPNTVVGQEIPDLDYVAERYGDPERAWQHELAYGWY